VPAVRGRERSRDPQEILAEIEQVAFEGVREVTLLGQNVNSYGRDLAKSDRVTFAELLRRVGSVPGIWRVRYTSPHPKDMREDVIAAMAEMPTLCEHVHLPAQSGSTRILRRMRRTYSRERYLELLGRIREGIADVSVTTDLIVGFPGETDEDFADTLSLVQEADYDGAFTFVYSPRPGTEAAETMEDDIPPALKSERIQVLIDTVHATSRARAGRFVGAEHEALVEGPSRTDPTRLRGRLRQNITVNFSGDAAPGTLAMVKITGASSTTLAGEQVGVHATA
jgi:tRNA-2-methylthio-N6-dimethylallyladenosine synthase